MTDGSDLYRQARQLFLTELQACRGEEAVPACPEWSVHDLVAHQLHQLTGVADRTFPISDSIDAVTAPDAGDRRGAAGRQELWIAAGVASLRSVDLAGLLTAWEEHCRNASDRVLGALFPDIAVHLFDLTGAVGSAAYRNSPLVRAAVEFWARSSGIRLRHAGVRGLRIEPHDAEPLGDDPAEVTLTGSGFELLRVLTGRRARDQARAITKQPVRDAVLEVIPAYGWRSTALIE